MELPNLEYQIFSRSMILNIYSNIYLGHSQGNPSSCWGNKPFSRLEYQSYSSTPNTQYHPPTLSCEDLLTLPYPVGPQSAESNGRTRYLLQSSNHHTMNITEGILGVYQDSVKAGLEVKLNLWSKGGNEYFSFSKTPGPQTQSQSWKRRMRRKKALEHLTEKQDLGRPQFVRKVAKGPLILTRLQLNWGP